MKKILTIALRFSDSSLGPVKKQLLEDGIEIKSLEGDPGKFDMQEILESDILLVSNSNMDDELDNFYSNLFSMELEIPIIALGDELISKGYYRVDKDFNLLINRYYYFSGYENILNLFMTIANKFLAYNYKLEDPREIEFNGIFHPESDEIFQSLEDYLIWYDNRFKPSSYLGLMTHRSNWLNDNLDLEYSLIKSFEDQGIGIVAVFSYSIDRTNEFILDFDDLLDSYFKKNGILKIEGLINLQILQPVSSSRENVFDKALERYTSLNIPIYKPLVSYYLTEEEWLKSDMGLVSSGYNQFMDPERTGMIEPLLLACRNEEGKNLAIDDRVERFTARVVNWTRLRKKKNSEKKLTIMLHNYPCAGVENNIGAGAGLDVFESVVNIFKSLEAEGYNIVDYPRTGKELSDLILSSKAHSDFRWTSVEDIVSAGGNIYNMPMEGEGSYLEIFNGLTDEVREDIIDSWGHPPGEAMVFDSKLVITGLNFGNIELMVQPKRGCYGAKCTGEVCKILHDPICPPSHQFIASYGYIERIFQADAVLHVGTSGSLEMLPGKMNALSKNCYPDICISNLVNIYIYNAGAGGEGTGAKRRSNALIIDHLPASLTSNRKYIDILNLIDEYIYENKTGGEKLPHLRKSLEKKYREESNIFPLNFLDFTLDEMIDYRNTLSQQISNLRSQDRHVFSEEPGLSARIGYIKEYLEYNNEKLMDSLKEDNYLDREDKLINLIEGALDDGYDDSLDKDLIFSIKKLDKLLDQTGQEMENLIRALNGEYIEAGLSGLPSDNFIEVLPTGRNFYMMDSRKVPSREAYERGIILADKLLETYYKDEARYPSKIAMNMISTDISGSKGEQLSQILSLIGVRPSWKKNGIVQGIEIIPLEELGRPRIDVTLRISGVLRDSFPEIIEYLDRAIVEVSRLDESIEDNYIRKHSLEYMEKLKEAGEVDIERRSTCRVFGNKPGAYGSGVDLLLKASAWEDDKDIVNSFVHFSSYGYGEGLSGESLAEEFIENIRRIDLSYEKNDNDRYSPLSSSYASSVHGGFSKSKEYLTGKKLRQYHGRISRGKGISLTSMEEEMEKNLEETLLNPIWKEDIKSDGYLGGAQVMRSFQIAFQWKMITDNLSDKQLDSLTEEYILDEETYSWFKDMNYLAMEEMVRRLLELRERGRWNPDHEILKGLQRRYIEIEGDMESISEKNRGEFQGSSIELINKNEVDNWKKNIEEIDRILSLESKNTDET